MTIRISEPLVCIMLGHGDSLMRVLGPAQDDIEAAGARVQSILVETLAHPGQLLCPLCLEPQDRPLIDPPLVHGVCWKCGEAFIGFRRSFKPHGFRWYSFNPF